MPLFSRVAFLPVNSYQLRKQASRLAAVSVGLETVPIAVMGRPLAVIGGVLPLPFN